MIAKLAWTGLAALACSSAFGQPAQAPAAGAAPVRFEIADVHVTPKALANTFMEANPPRNGRYEFHSASMIDLIRLAYGFDDDKILGGPSWLEMDRFEVVAQLPAEIRMANSAESGQGALPEVVRTMLQSLLADRFHLVVREETKPLPGYVMTVDKKLQMKEAEGTGATGCRHLPSTDTAEKTDHFTCRNMTMEAFAGVLRLLADVAPAAVIDQTELTGRWDFDLRLPSDANAQAAGNEIHRQLGLKLEARPIPASVLVIQSANEVPTANLPRVAEVLPPAPQPTAFDVATFKPTDPAYPASTISLSPRPGGLWVSRGVLLSALLVRAFSPSFAQRNEDLVVGMPGWARTARFDLTARSPAGAPASARAGPMVRSLLEERLKLKWHAESRPVSVYVLLAAKPKMKTADPASRTHCRRVSPPMGSPRGAASVACQNTTMEQFAEIIRNRLPGPGSAVIDSTGLEGGWDFTVTYVDPPGSTANSSGDAAAQAAGLPAASDPNGGLPIVEAIYQQLGLKLEIQKRPMTVTVIDHLEQAPTDN